MQGSCKGDKPRLSLPHPLPITFVPFWYFCGMRIGGLDAKLHEVFALFNLT